MSHIHEKIDFTVGVFVVYEDKVLLRKHDKYGMWICVGGHIELDEDPNQAALREVKEEVGLDVSLWKGNKLMEFVGPAPYFDKEIIPPVSICRHNIGDKGHEHVDLKYFAKANTDKVTPENQTDEWRWVSKGELSKFDLQPNIMKLAELAIDSVKEF